MSFFTPVKLKTDPVFKTPMSFSPRLNGDKARPSPSKFELWKEELGLNDDGGDASDDDSNSDGEPEADRKPSKRAKTELCSLAEYEALQKELEERNAQRDDLVYKIKMMTEKNKSYRVRLEKEEASRKQQLRILSRTHEVQLAEKAQLIATLESMIDEHEQRISQLESGKLDDQNEVSDRLHRLVKQIQGLQEDKVSLTSQLLTTQTNLENALGKHDGDLDSVRERVNKLEDENSGLQDEVIRLRGLKSMGSTDAEKQACRLEIENDRLQHDIQVLRSQIETQATNSKIGTEKQLSKLKEDNETLTARISHLEEELSARTKEFNTVEEQLRTEVKKLSAECQTSEKEARELSAKLTAFHARSPEIVTRVQKVEVEVESAKLRERVHEHEDEIRRLHSNLQEVENERSNLQTKLHDVENSLRTQLHEAEKHLQSSQKEYDTERTSTQALLAKTKTELEEIQKTKSELECQIGDLQKAKCEIDSKAVELEKRLKDSQSDLQLSQSENAKLSVIADNNTKLQADLKSSQGRVIVLQDQVSTLEDEMREVEMELRTEMDQLVSRKDAELKAAERAAEERMAETTHTLAYLKDRLAVVQPEMAALAKEYRRIKQHCNNFPKLVQVAVQDTTKKVVKAISDINQQNQELVRKYRKEMALRKKYHNELVDLKGNIRVFCRARPVIGEDGSGSQAAIVVAPDTEDDGIIHVEYKSRIQSFELDRVFDPSYSQEDVFREVQALVTSCIDGYNVCIFAYGQTGSGKTFTMEGNKANPGINQRALQELFRETSERSQEWEYRISVGVIEIYNESLRDLLSSDPTSKLEIKMAADRGLYVPGLKSVEVSSVSHVNQVFKLGHENRATATTNMNEHSSRSHALLCVTVEGTNTTTGAKTYGKLNLVDLAGSERVSKSGADGARLKEAQSINKSLSCLGDVIHALRAKQSHIPYRNSKLTYLLQDSLGGDSKTLMIVQIAPVEKNVSETLASLNFAQRVRSVELGQATKRLEAGENDRVPFEPGSRPSRLPQSKSPRQATAKSPRDSADQMNKNNHMMNGGSKITSKITSSSTKIPRR